MPERSLDLGPSRHDRIVHGITRDGHEIVRYDRAGKWYLEESPGPRRRAVTLDEAVFEAIQDGAQVFPDRPGGMRFNAVLRDEGAL